MEQTRIEKQIAFLVGLDELKTIYRRAYLAADPSRRENDAEHSWHITVGALILREYAPLETNIDRVVRMLLVHDIIEIDAGDVSIYQRTDPQQIARNEADAARRIFGLLPADQGNELLDLWSEFEANATPEARFARAIDRIFPLLFNYFTQGKRWREDHITYQQVLAVNQKIREGSPRLFEYAMCLIEDSLAKGYLQREQ